MPLRTTNLSLRNGLVVPTAITDVNRVTIDFRRDRMRVDFVTMLEGAEAGATPLSSHSVTINGVNRSQINALLNSAFAKLKAEDPQFATAAEV